MDSACQPNREPRQHPAFTPKSSGAEVNQRRHPSMKQGPEGGIIFDDPATLYVSGRGWVTCWSEVFEHPAIFKRMYERPATDDEVFTAQMTQEANGQRKIRKAN